MVTIQCEWRILQWDEKPQNPQTNNIPCERPMLGDKFLTSHPKDCPHKFAPLEFNLAPWLMIYKQVD